MKTLVVVNPRSGGGRTGRSWVDVSRRIEAVLGPFEAHITAHAGEATEVVRAALSAGTERIVAVGGDGTNHEVVNGFFTASALQPLAADAVFAFLPSGTGGDFGRSFDLPADLDARLARIAASPAARIDAIACRWQGAEPGIEVSINIASAGQGGLVCARVDASPKWLGGGLPFLVAGMRTLVDLKPWPVHIALDDEAPRFVRAINILAGNGRYQGGGMHMLPEARLDDGLIDVLVVPEMSAARQVQMALYSHQGRMLELPGVWSARAKRLEVTPAAEAEPMPLEMDGEARGTAPVVFEVLPAALRLAV